MRFAFFFLLFFATKIVAQNNLYFPPAIGNTWAVTPPAELGFCPERVDSLYQFLEQNSTKSFILLQDGKIVLEKYFGTFTRDSFWYWASAGKSLTAFLVGQAQAEGLLDIHAPTSAYLGTGWTSCPPDKEMLITPWHQLTMTSGLEDVTLDDNCTDPACLQYKADAGTRWAYYNAPYRLLHDVIEAAAGQTINLFTKTRVFDPTGMKGLWIDHIMYGRARDMARFGLLVLANGVWNGDTLLHDPQYFFDMTHPSQDLNKSYGYLWWLNGQPSFMLPEVPFVFPGKIIPNAPDDLFAALGKNDQKIHVVPSKGWVVVRQGEASGGPNGNFVPVVFDNQLWARLNTLVCNPTAVQETAHKPEITIQPNPTVGAWTISAAAPIERLELYNSAGQPAVIRTGLSDYTHSIEAADLPTGVYFLKIWSGGSLQVRSLLRRD